MTLVCLRATLSGDWERVSERPREKKVFLMSWLRWQDGTVPAPHMAQLAMLAPPSPCSRRQHATPSLSNTHTPNLELPLALSCQQPYQNQYKLSCQNFRFNDLVLVCGGGSQTRRCSCISDVTNWYSSTSCRESCSPASQRISVIKSSDLASHQSWLFMTESLPPKVFYWLRNNFTLKQIWPKLNLLV